jgi:hypothetical protein
MNTITFTLPDYWAPALINGDETGLDDDESAALTEFCEWLNSQGINACAIDCTEESEFRHTHDATEWVLACNCLDFTFTRD